MLYFVLTDNVIMKITPVYGFKICPSQLKFKRIKTSVLEENDKLESDTVKVKENNRLNETKNSENTNTVTSSDNKTVTLKKEPNVDSENVKKKTLETEDKSRDNTKSNDDTQQIMHEKNDNAEEKGNAVDFMLKDAIVLDECASDEDCKINN